mmetsp:Transcript_3932/g.4690  ORF Transcript_3932/g.4690 Transcript_3932/m.4690 type:complete len:110 (-) Transcript_3932:1281-1610(-)
MGGSGLGGLGAPPAQMQAPTSLAQLSPELQNSMWVLRPEDKARYAQMYGMFDKEGRGYLTQEEMQQVMQSTKLEKAVCAKVWQLSNPKLTTTFSKSMFAIAMHLMFKKR